MPPVHPAIVHLPIAFVVLSVVCEFIGYFFNSRSARTVAWWALVAAAIGGALAVAAGYYDLDRASLTPETQEIVHQHLKIGWILVLSVLGLTVWRGFLRHERQAAIQLAEDLKPGFRTVGWGYLSAALLVLLLTLFQGWYGGEMVYSHGAGAAAAGQGMVPPEKARQRLEPVRRILNAIPGLAGDRETVARQQGGSPSPAPAR